MGEVEWELQARSSCPAQRGTRPCLWCAENRRACNMCVVSQCVPYRSIHAGTIEEYTSTVKRYVWMNVRLSGSRLRE